MLHSRGPLTHRVEKREFIIAWRSQKDLPREETWGGPKCLLPNQCHLLKGLQPRHLAHQTTVDLSSNKPKFWWQLDTPVSIQHGSVARPSSNTGFHPFCLFFLLCCHLKSFLLPTHSNTLFFSQSSSKLTSCTKHLSTHKYLLPCDFLVCCTVLNVFRWPRAPGLSTGIKFQQAMKGGF